MRVTARLAIGSGLVLAIVIGVLAYELVQIRKLSEVSQDLVDSGLATVLNAMEQVHGIEEIEAAARKAVVTGDRDYAGLAARRTESLRTVLTKYRASLADPETERLAEEEEKALARIQSEASALPGSGDGEKLLAHLREAGTKARTLVAAARADLAERAAMADLSARQAKTVSLAAAVLALFLAFGVLVMTAHSINAPLGRLAHATRAVALGRFDAELDESGGDEFARVAQDFNLMARRLGELDAAKKSFLSHVSHEMKTPLAGIQESIQLLLEEVPGPLAPDQRRLLELNLQSARRLSAMIAKMLDLARLEAGVMGYDLAARDVRPLLSGAVKELEVHATEKGVNLVLEVPPAPLGARCDGDRLVQVFLNLVENAVKFSPRGAAVEVEARAESALAASVPEEAAALLLHGPVVAVTVSDRGPGVPDDQKERVFEWFHQVGRGKSGGGGVGLGLAICRQIVHAHGGSLWVEDRPGGGSRFRLVLSKVAVGVIL